MRTRSLRFRLTLWYAVILSAGLGLSGGLLWLSLRARLISEIDRDLDGRAGRFEKYFRSESAETQGNWLRGELNEFCQALPPASYVSLSGSDGFNFRYPATPAAADAKLRILRRHFSLNGAGFDLEVAAPMGDAQHTLDLVRLLLAGLIPVVIAIACLGGMWISRRALKPVRDITAAATTIGIENLSERLPVPATGDELAKLTEVLNSMLARLESAVKTLSQFVADASHELRTPLAVIRTTAELATRRVRPADSYRESLYEIALESERMTHLVEDLLVLARSDTGTFQMPLGPVDVREVIEDVCAELRGLADLRQIRIETVWRDRESVISGNRPALHRLFLVLLDNAVKYSKAGGKVIVMVERGQSQITASIEDFGSGIAEADLPHIFKRFFRADRARGKGGYGLGLSLADSIARAHNAAIDVRSVEGAGTVFQVIFTARDAALDAARPGTVSSAI